jgi:hypothetical protein
MLVSVKKTFCFSCFEFQRQLTDVSVPDEVLVGRLYLGAEGSARNASALSELSITHVLSVCHFTDMVPVPMKCHLIIRVDDSLDTDLSKYFVRIFFVFFL